MKNLLIAFCLLSIASSCTHVVFDVPQPSDENSLTEFPEAFRGFYYFEKKDQDSLIVSESTVTFVEHSSYELPVDSIDTMLNITLRDGLLYNSDLMLAKGVPYVVDDSVIRYEYHDRHIIGISDTVVVKMCGRYLVVSSNFTDDELDYWDVVLVEKPNANEMRISGIGNLNPPGNEDNSANYRGQISDFEKVAPVEKLSDDTFLFRPTPKQFKKLVKKNLFSEKQVYTRFR